MNAKLAGVAAAVLVLGGTARAWQLPQATGDTHVRQVTYRADQVVRIIAQRGFATHIALDPAEHILVVAPGDRDGWQVVAREGDHDVYLKPQLAAHDTNMEIRTDLHSYSLDLRVLPLDARAGSTQAMYRVTFTYPDTQAAAAAQALVRERMNQPPLVRNASYSMQVVPGSDDIAPAAAWDDGRFTYIRISGNRRVPAITRVAADGSESVVDRHMEGDVIVVHEVARRFALRLGSEVVGLWNDAFDADGVPPVDGTTVGGVKRALRSDGHE